MVRFSLTTFLVCIMVAAIILSYCLSWPYAERMYFGYPNMRSPGPYELLARLAVIEPPALMLTVIVIQSTRKIWRSQQTGRTQGDWDDRF